MFDEDDAFTEQIRTFVPDLQVIRVEVGSAYQRSDSLVAIRLDEEEDYKPQRMPGQPRRRIDGRADIEALQPSGDAKLGHALHCSDSRSRARFLGRGEAACKTDETHLGG